MSPQDNKAVVQELYDQWNSGAIDFERLVQPDIANHQPDRDPETGLEDFVVCHNRWSGTYGGKVFRGVPSPPGGRFSVEHVHIGAIPTPG